MSKGRVIPFNVVDHRFLDGNAEVAAIKSATLPNIEVATATINASGMLGPLDVPTTNQINSMEWSVDYDGTTREADVLHRPGKHVQELRVVEDNFDRVTSENKLQSVKYRFEGMWKSSSGGNVEKGSPGTVTETYSCTRYQKIVDGVETILVDKIKGQFVVDGVDYAADVRAMLE